MREFAESFYKSRQWQDCRAAFLKSKRGLCESCLAKGIYKPAVIVHHIIELTPDNISDPRISLSWSNLKAVCRDCHGLEHRPNQPRYKVDELGRVIFKQ